MLRFVSISEQRNENIKYFGFPSGNRTHNRRVYAANGLPIIKSRLEFSLIHYNININKLTFSLLISFFNLELIDSGSAARAWK